MGTIATSEDQPKVKSAPPRGATVATYVLLFLGSLAFIVPFYFIVNGSLKSSAAVQAGDFIRPVFLPDPPPGKVVAVSELTGVVQKAIREIATEGSAVSAVYVSPPNTIVDLKSATSEFRRAIFDPDGKLLENIPLQTGIHWANYSRALSKEKMDFRPALANTVVITTCCVLGQIISCSLVGFGFARFRFRRRSFLFMVMLSTMMLPAQITMIPVFILFKSMNLIDSFWPLIIPAWLASPFFVFMFRQFFTQIPEELIEAARIDGASNFRIYAQIMLPLSGPVIAIVAIYTFLGTWNDFLGPLIYLNSPENRTLALALNAFKGQYGTTDAQLLMAASVVCMIPCVVLFFACQKYFVESVATTGGK